MKITKQLLYIIFLFSVAARVGVSLYLGDKIVTLPGVADQISYHTLATRVLSGFGFSFGQMWWPITAAGAPTAHWSFLYVFYLVGVYTIAGIHPLAARLFQAVLTGILQPYLVFLISRKLFNEWVGLIAAAMIAFYAYFIYYGGTLMTEPFFITAILASIYLSMLIVERARKKEAGSQPPNYIAFTSGQAAGGLLHSTGFLSLALGLMLGAAILLRQLFMLFVPFLLLWIVWNLRGVLKEQIRVTIFSVLVITAMILPFTIFNYARFGRFVLLNTNAGYAFYWANHPVYGTHFESILDPMVYASMLPPELLQLDEAALDQSLLRLGLQFVIRDPMRYLLLSVSRIPVYFKFWPSPDDGMISNISRVASFGVLWPFMLYGMLRSVRVLRGTAKRWKDIISSPIFLLYSFIVIYTAIHLLSWSLIRYRLPVDAVLIIFSGFAFYDLFPHLVSRRIRMQSYTEDSSI